MYALLLDSSNKNLSVGLALDGKLVDRTSYEAWQKQSELLVDEIDKTLVRNKIGRKDIGSVVVSKGPGSYTGVRIAMSVAKTMSFALGVPLYLVSSLQVQEVAGKPTICLMNARSKRSYIGVYRDAECLLEDTVIENQDVLEYIKNHPDYEVSGELSQLGLEDKPGDILGNLLKADVPANLCDEPLAAKPVYLKDTYQV
ncbi:MAG: tRNA (adenosine(37)-N6)-threonylcarbamoyltransferase complex dimerization subunit type 1 TsaB [Bacilli bacterium]|jgi:tRNA threonylcarbamoyl adenosine modification protein YeaZ|nr:tRNA (adenosine(37)-N6)-threonylcarbamoyltransferase complex dimerization subunit type 1 TsaB [Bacilli bacterium]